ncbi:MAG: hypothetical protein K6F00_03605 [Lachnospiraceae bacterium]|nr:hypothetical protein [Lachnospiraceae bacterium]
MSDQEYTKKQKLEINTYAEKEEDLGSKVNEIPEPSKTKEKKKSGWSFLIPKAIWDKSADDGQALYERSVNMAGPGEEEGEVIKEAADNEAEKTDEKKEDVKNADVKQENVKQADEKKADAKKVERRDWLDMLDDDLETSSMKFSREVMAEAFEWTNMDMKSADFESFTDKTKEIIRDINTFNDPRYKNADVYLPKINAMNFLREFKADLTEVQNAAKDPVVLNLKSEAFKNKYKGYSDKEIDILSTYASVLLAEQVGNLDLEGKVIEDYTDDSLFKPIKYDLIPPKKDTEGVKYNRVMIGYGNKSDYSAMPLFAHEPNTMDIKQGEPGDCFFLSTLNSMIEQDPDSIKDMMRDEGKTVVVRFYDQSGNPLYIRVNKTIPSRYYYSDEPGKGPITDGKYGNKGCFWVNIIEKAYAMVRTRIEDPKVLKRANIDPNKEYEGFGVLTGGFASVAYKTLTGNKYKLKSKALSGLKFGAKYVKLSSLFDEVRNGEKKEYLSNIRKEKPKAGVREWNIYRAKEIFGVEIKSEEDPFYALIKKNTLFDKYEKYLKELSKDYCSLDFSLSKELSFHSVMDIDYFMEGVDLNKMPDTGIPGIDEKKVKEQYISYFKRRIRASGLLKNYVNMTGKYTTKEQNIFNEIKAAVSSENKKLATVEGVPQWSLERKKDKNKGGNREVIRRGLASGHEYAIVGTKEKEKYVNGEKLTYRFVILQNPWRNYVTRLYDKDTGEAYSANDTPEYDSKIHGTNEVELTDFINTFLSYNIMG